MNRYFDLFFLRFYFSLGILLGIYVCAMAQTTTVNYSISDEDFPNPERGFYRASITFTSNFSPLNQSYLESLRTPQVPFDANYSVVSTLLFRYYVLDNFKTGPISANILSLIESDFAIARQSGMKLIPRFSYVNSPDPSGCSDNTACPPYGDASKAVVLNHISQLTPILQNNTDVIAALQMGFIGIWGEGFYTDHFGDASQQGNGRLLDQDWIDRSEVLSALLQALPLERMIQTRYPQKKQRFLGGVNVPTSFPPMSQAEAYSGSDASRIGFHNDCFVANFNDFGTYNDYGNSSSPQIWADTVNLKPYKTSESRFVVIGGETCSDDYNPENNCGSTHPLAYADSEMERMHYSYLNADYNQEVNNDWETGGCMDDIKKRLGYRFELGQGTFSSSGRPGGVVNFTLNIRNVGYAAPYNPRRVEIILRNTANGSLHYVYPDADPRFWAAGTTNTLDFALCLPPNLPTGTYDWLFGLTDPAPSLEDNPDYSIRLAARLPSGAEVWEASSGLNRLGAQLTVTNASPGSNCSNELVFTTSSSPLPVSWLHFTARAQTDEIKLSWQTEWEENNAGFEIERSTNARHFSSIGFQQADPRRTYQFTDTEVLAGQRYFYRLRQIDLTGEESLSPVASAMLQSGTDISSISIFPNPASQQVTLLGISDFSQGYLSIYNLQGTEVQRQALQSQIDVSTLAGGVYFFRIEVVDKIQTLKFIKK
ncbi:MAG: DUF4832 domain-containing protein [Bacteroidota bacterium]